MSEETKMATISQDQLNSLLSRLDKLESADTKSLQTENELLRKQLEATGERRQTESEAAEEARELLNRSRAPKPPGKYEWEVSIQPFNRKDGRGKQAVYAIPLTHFSKSKNATVVLEEIRRRLGCNLEANNCSLSGVGFQPEGRAVVKEDPKRQLFPAGA